jgi:hypothetical protein
MQLRCGELKNEYNILAGKPLGKQPLRRLKEMGG